MTSLIEAIQVSYEVSEKENAELKAEVKRLWSALLKYARHTDRCNKVVLPIEPDGLPNTVCTCGLLKLLAEQEAKA